MSEYDERVPPDGTRTEAEELFAGVHFFILADILVFAALFAGFMSSGRPRSRCSINPLHGSIPGWACSTR